MRNRVRKGQRRVRRLGRSFRNRGSASSSTRTGRDRIVSLCITLEVCRCSRRLLNRSSCSPPASSEPPASSPPLNIRPSFEQQVESSIYGHLEPIPAAPDQSPPQAELTSFPKRKASLDAIRSPTIVEPAPELPSRTYDYAPTAPLRTSDLTAPRPAPAIPSGSYDSISIPPTLQPTVSSDSSRSAYTTLSQATTTPTDVSSPSQSPADVPLPHTPLTPTQPSSDYLPYGSPRDDLTSPRSEYTPQTPTLNVYDDPSHDYRQAASAPATPAAWNKHLEAGSRFSRQPARPKHRFSADIDQLLNQMHEIDFADEESLDQSYAGMDSSEGGSERSSSAASRHRTRQASGPAPPLSPVTEGKTAPPSPPTTKEYPKSMDLTALAGLMTSDLYVSYRARSDSSQLLTHSSQVSSHLTRARTDPTYSQPPLQSMIFCTLPSLPLLFPRIHVPFHRFPLSLSGRISSHSVTFSPPSA